MSTFHKREAAMPRSKSPPRVKGPYAERGGARFRIRSFAEIFLGCGPPRTRCSQRSETSCNSYHTAAGKHGAPGRILVP